MPSFIAVFSFLIEILQWKVLHLNYSNVRFYVTGSREALLI